MSDDSDTPQPPSAGDDDLSRANAGHTFEDDPDARLAVARAARELGAEPPEPSEEVRKLREEEERYGTKAKAKAEEGPGLLISGFRIEEDNARLEADDIEEGELEAHRGRAFQEGRGCLKMVGIPIAGLLIIALVIGLVLFSRGGSDKKTSSKRDSTAQSSAQPADDASGFAGHYVLAKGLDDPSGLDLHGYGSQPNVSSLGKSSATIDVAGNVVELFQWAQ